MGCPWALVVLLCRCPNACCPGPVVAVLLLIAEVATFLCPLVCGTVFRNLLHTGWAICSVYPDHSRLSMYNLSRRGKKGTLSSA